MTHQVLARKWRPRAFDALVGQPHVVRALSHALESGRLHHAYLFTGTRGVGKTTLARILAKAVNCESGLGPSPCGHCPACVAIDGGRFVDVIELDAASNRGVDEMTQLLENAVYAPVAGRYKVYVIDEVHMLTHHAFNAMLKTLEEPPPHLLFVLATTDPQKVPVTVLSRCMQFNLRNVRPGDIAAHLQTILQAEQVPAEDAALELLGRQAAGSVRDALSLTDQAIAHGGGQLTEQAVRDMLGLLDGRHADRVLDALAAEDGAALVALADEIAAENLSADALLADLAECFSALAVHAALGDTAATGDDRFLARVAPWCARFDAYDLQVYYQVVLHARRDLALAPDVRAGLTMALLRMFAFRAGAPDEGRAPEPVLRPAAGVEARGERPAAAAGATAVPAAARVEVGTKAFEPPRASAAVERPAPPADTEPRGAAGAALRAVRAARERQRTQRPQRLPAEPEEPGEPAEPAGHDDSPAWEAAGRRVSPARDPAQAQSASGAESSSTASRPGPPPHGAEPPAARSRTVDVPHGTPLEHWPALADRLGLPGRDGEFMRQSELLDDGGGRILVRVPIATLADERLLARVAQALATHLGRPGLRLEAEIGRVSGPTAAGEALERQAERERIARDAIASDPFVRSMVEHFGARIVPDSIRPVSQPSTSQGDDDA